MACMPIHAYASPNPQAALHFRAMEHGWVIGMTMAEVKRANRAFRAPFRGSAHEEIHRQMVQLRNEVSELCHYSVYAAVVQTSGAGKSRGVLEMSKLAPDDAVFICYCSLAGPASTSFPPRTQVLAERLQRHGVSELDMVLYLKAWLLVLERALAKNVSAAQWMEAQLPPLDCDPTGPWSSSLAVEVRKEWDRLMAGGAQEEVEVAGSGSGSDCSFKFMDEIVDEETEDVEDQANRKLIQETAARVAKQLPGVARVVWVFDEALGLLPNTEPHHSPFYKLRGVLRVFFGDKTYFALMLDTSVKVANLLPSWSLEKNDRALKPGVGLLPPIYFIPNLKLRKPIVGKSLEHYVDPRVWLQYGRPLWSARLAQNRSLKHLVHFASQKLLGTVKGHIKSQAGVEKVDIVNGEVATSQALALLSAATGLDVCPLSSFPELMVASHMNLLLRVSSDRSRIYVGLPVEPILAEAAAHVLNNKATVTLMNVLSLMEKACMYGYVTPGPRGEFVAKFILVSAVWALKTHGDSWYLRPIPVDDYLEKLLVTGKSDKPTFKNMKAKRPALPDQGTIFFNSFVSVKRPPDAAMLGRCFAAGQAIAYPAENNLPGADLIIPIWTPNGMTCMVVSVKNLARPLEDVSVRKMKCEFTSVKVAEGLPVYTVVMSLREPSMKNSGEEWSWILWDEKLENDVHLTCYGLENNYSFLSKKVKAQLRQILFTVPDALAGASDEEINWIQEVLPEKFEEPDASFSCLRE